MKLLALGLVLSSGLNVAVSHAAIVTERIVTLDAEEVTIAKAWSSFKANHGAEALPLFKKAIESPVFASIEPSRQHAIYQLSGAIAYDLKEYRLAQSYFAKACESPHAEAEDWKQRYFTSFQLNDKADKSTSLMMIAQRWPATLSEINDDAILHTANDAIKDFPADAKTLELLASLFASGWRMEGEIEPSSLWFEYASMLIARDKLAEAKSVAARITSPGDLISMRADNRFLVLVRSMPERFDINEAAATEFAARREFCAKHPQNLQGIVQMSYSLLTLRQYAETLKITDEVINAVQKAKKENPPYEDLDDSYIWILNNRALALEGLGRWDEALEQLIRAARRPEHAGTNVSQAINLAGFYNDLERPKDALFTLLDVENMSPYGRMQLEAEKYRAALQLQDSTAATLALSYLREHRKDSIATYQHVLMEGGDIDGAAAVLIERIQDPGMRRRALLSMQDFDPAPALPHVSRFNERVEALQRRPDVTKAVAAVGRIEHYSISADFL